MKFKQTHTIFITLLLMISTSSAEAGLLSLINDCRAVVLALTKPLPLQQEGLGLPPAVWDELKLAKEKAIEKSKQRTRNNDAERIPEFFYLNGKEYKFKRYLGSGGEAHVYLVERNGEPFVIKQFGTWPIVENINWARTLGLRGHSIAETVEVNKKKQVALYPFIDGITMVHFYYDESPILYMVSSHAKELVVKRYEEFKQMYNPGNDFKKTSSAIYPANVVLDFNKKKFVIIDPH